MTPETFKEIIKSGSVDEKREALWDADAQLFNDDIFLLLFELLNDDHPSNRFFAIFHLIDKFPDALPNVNEEQLEQLYNALYDDNIPVNDRAIWALSIIGNKAFDLLVQRYHEGNIEVKTKISFVLGKGTFQGRHKEQLEILLKGLDSENLELKYWAMSSIMHKTPVSRYNQQEYLEDVTVDFDQIYDIILPIAKDFSTSDDEHIREYSTRYASWIEKEKMKITIQRQEAKMILAEKKSRYLTESEKLKLLEQIFPGLDETDYVRELIADGDLPELKEELIQSIESGEFLKIPMSESLKPVFIHLLNDELDGVTNEYLALKLNSSDREFNVIGDIEPKGVCPCCEYHSIGYGEDGFHDICPVCFWQNGGDGPNHMPLTLAQVNFSQFGAMDKIHLGSIDPEGKIKYKKHEK